MPHAEDGADRRLFISLWLVAVAVSFSFHLLTASLPLYVVSLGADSATVGLLTGFIATVALVGRPTVGWWMDRGGGITPLLAGITIYFFCAIGYWVAPSVRAVLGIRAVQGVGVALFATAIQTLSVNLAPADRRAEALGLFGVAFTFAQGLAPPAGVAIARIGDYPAVFAACAVLSALAMAIAWPLRALRANRAQRGLRMIHRGVLLPGILVLAIMVTFGANIALLAVHAGRRGLANPGFVFLPHALGLLAAQLVTGRLSDRSGRLSVIAPGLAVAASGAWVISVASGAWLLLGSALAGMGLGAAQPSIHALAADLVPPEERGTAMGTLGVFHELGVIAGSVGGGLAGRSLGLGATFVLSGTVAAAGSALALLHAVRGTRVGKA